MFSALEVVPLSLLGFEVVHNLRVIKAGGKAYAYKWPIYFFISVAFWNLIGAGMFGFLINPPIVLYFAVKHGLWFARSPEITSGPVLRALAWARLIPDVIFFAGAIVLFLFLLRAIWLTFIKQPNPQLIIEKG